MMRRIHDKFGSFYGELVFLSSTEENYSIGDRPLRESIEIVKRMYSMGCKNLHLDVEDGENYSCTLFFEIDEKTDMKKLMIEIFNLRAHEFSEESNNCYRVWWD